LQGDFYSRLSEQLDVTGLVLKEFGHARALSAALGAIAGRLLGLKAESTQTAIARELAELGLTVPVIEQNQRVAAHCYESVKLFRWVK
jgi:hypothetical protein